MPIFHVHAINHAFHLSNTATKFKNVEEAKLAGLETAVSILAEEASTGIPNATVVITITDEEKAVLARTAVTLAIAPLVTTGAI